MVQLISVNKNAPEHQSKITNTTIIDYGSLPTVSLYKPYELANLTLFCIFHDYAILC